MKYYRVIPTLLIILTDMAAAAAGFYLAYYWRTNGQELFQWPLSRYLSMVWPFILLYPVLFAILGVYPPTHSKKEFERIPLLIAGVLCNWALIIVWLFFVRNEASSSISRLVVVYILFSCSATIILGRWFYWYLYKIIGLLGITRTNVFLITNHSDVAMSIERTIRSRANLFQVMGTAEQLPFAKIKKLAERDAIDEVFILNPHFPDKEIFKLLEITIPHSISVKLLPNLLSSLTPVIDDDTIPAMPLVEFKTTPLYGWGRFLKRAFDMALSTLALLILSPIILVIGLAVKLDSRGPVFYLHRRLGLNGKVFKVFKFRTMKLEFCRGRGYGGAAAERKYREMMNQAKYRAELEANFKVKNDPRVTRVGRFLRRTSLDEMPQFINVWLGSLSLVGPRPVIREEVERYKGAEYLLWSVRPGLSGLWQVSGRSELSYEERVKLDLFYIENWSPWMDIIVLIKTIIQIFVGRGAY